VKEYPGLDDGIEGSSKETVPSLSWWLAINDLWIYKYRAPLSC